MTTADLQVRLGEKIKTIRTEKKMTQNKCETINLDLIIPKKIIRYIKKNEINIFL